MKTVMDAPPADVQAGADRTPGCEALLVEEARRGSQHAFGELVQRYERRVVRVIKQFIHNVDLAEDLAQETFLKAWRKLSTFDPSRRFGPWLFRIAVNLTLDHLRRRKRRGWWSLFSESRAERPPDPATADPRQELDLRQEVQAVLEKIPESYRLVLVLRELENLSTSEIAAILGRAEGTIRWRLVEARNRFQQLWVKRRDQLPVPFASGAEGLLPSDDGESDDE